MQNRRWYILVFGIHSHTKMNISCFGIIMETMRVLMRRIKRVVARHKFLK